METMLDARLRWLRALLVGSVAFFLGTAGHVMANGLLPGPFDTDRLRATVVGVAAKTGQTVEQVLDERRQGIPTRRYGTAEEFGAMCAFICSVHTGYITGQNLLLDGGGYPGTY